MVGVYQVSYVLLAGRHQFIFLKYVLCVNNAANDDYFLLLVWQWKPGLRNH